MNEYLQISHKTLASKQASKQARKQACRLYNHSVRTCVSARCQSLPGGSESAHRAGIVLFLCEGKNESLTRQTIGL